MKKHKSEDKEILEDWISATGKDKAPESLMQNIMTQVEIEPLSSIDIYSTRISLKFKLIAASLSSLLITAALSLPTSNLTIIDKISAFKLPSIQLPEITYPGFKVPFSIHPYYILIIIGLFGLLFLFDRFLYKLFFLTASGTRD